MIYLQLGLAYGEVLQMAVEDRCEHDMLVQIRWQGRKMAVLSRTERHRSRRINGEAIGDWSYWVARGYCF